MTRRRRHVVVAAAVALAGVLFVACGGSDAGAGASGASGPTTAPGPAKGILDADTVARVTAADGTPVFEHDEATCLARNLDGGVSAEELGWIKAGHLSSDADFPPHQDLIEQISALGKGCVSDERLRDAMVAALTKAQHGSPDYAECLVDTGYFSPSVGYVFEWTMFGIMPADVKSSGSHSDCSR